LKTKPIKYYSTNLKSPEVFFKEALLSGLAPDGGLFMPDYIPKINMEEIESYSGKEYHEIAFCVLNYFLNNEIESNSLMSLCKEAYDFEVPVENVFDNNFILRLDQGPTASFKDFAARMMARLMNHFISAEQKHFTILTATSGDTGSAVASAFHGLKNIEVIILFPYMEVTATQRKQMTTFDDNVRVIALDGKFDDCQKLVKRAFSDPSLSLVSLTSANSINIGRLLPQSVYYFYAWSRLSDNIHHHVTFSVPSGNYGNLMGGIIAREMGLPVKRMIISTNQNYEGPEYLRTGTYETISPSINCISSAMNVGHPSNLARIIALYGGRMDEKGIILKNPDISRMRKDFFGISVSDDETRETIAECFNKYRLLLEPHGAVAWKGMERYQNIEPEENRQGQLFVSLETAHPAKFIDEFRNLSGYSLTIPDSLSRIESKQEAFIKLENNYEMFRNFILSD
jgi:threonine synthase